MTNEELANVWLDALRTQDGSSAAAVLTDDAGLDDFGGGHYVGRDRLVQFANDIPPGIQIDIRHSLPDADGRRLTCFGDVQLPGWDDIYKVRWSFWFEGGRLLQIVNSRVTYLFGVEPNPFDDKSSETWTFS